MHHAPHNPNWTISIAKLDALVAQDLVGKIDDLCANGFLGPELVAHIEAKHPAILRFLVSRERWRATRQRFPRQRVDNGTLAAMVARIAERRAAARAQGNGGPDSGPDSGEA